MIFGVLILRENDALQQLEKQLKRFFGSVAVIC
jgi:hypothetical protein